MIEERRGLTFAQAEGAEELPRQLDLRQISSELTAVLWAVIYEMLQGALQHDGGYGSGYYFSKPWKTILDTWWVIRLHKNIDEIPNPQALIALVKSTVTSGDYIKVFDFLQFVMSRTNRPAKFEVTIDNLLKNTRSAYRVIDYHLVPISSDEAADTVRAALALAKDAMAQGPYTHLRAGSSAASAGNWTEVVRESIHAVEAAAISIEPSATTLGPALERLKASIGLHPALLKAYGALYGYSSDEKGIRHALVFKEAANLGEREALFMLGACAAFVGYLLSAKNEVSSNPSSGERPLG